ncbi:MAG: acylneuraminate cytidylyltransferase family protein [Spirochaetes bacterium]|nr:acylneuraminate cytidylyltransferase family protein [Spirochaetota bacterium]
MPNIVAIIPARGGSKGVPGKNIKPLAGHPLIAWSIAAAKLSKRVEGLVITTDSEEIAEVCRRYGEEVPFLRPAAYAGDKSTDRDFMIHALDWWQANRGPVPEYWVHLRSTTPLRDPAHLDEAIEAITAAPGATCLRSAHPAPESPFKWFRKTEDGQFTGLDPNETRPDATNLPRQAFPDVFIPDGYVDVLRASFIRSGQMIHGPKIRAWVSPVSVEVDRPEDFERLEFLAQRQRPVLLDWLDRNRRA